MKGKYKQCLSNTSHSPECVSHNRRYLPAAIQDNLPTSEDNYAMHSSAAIKYHPPRIIICNYALQLWSAVNVMNWNARCRITSQPALVLPENGVFSLICWRNLASCVSPNGFSLSPTSVNRLPSVFRKRNNTTERGTSTSKINITVTI